MGPWRVVDRRGRGAYGTVYRAVRADGATGLVALKLALHPRDKRFTREVELLSRIRHPNVPRLMGHGDWQHPAGPLHPYLAMEWVEGLSLYEWARECQPSSRRVLHLLASLARALAATHAAGGLHRDVKGDNVLVSALDGQPFLTDFGSGHYLGAATLTGPPFPPGTPAYRSPEAWGSVRLPLQKSAVPYAPGPADDVFALGVTAYRLVTDEYPPGADDLEDGARLWHLDGPGPRPPRAVNVRCCAELSAVVSRMISVRPEARGSARELAEVMEKAARKAGPEADAPLFVQAEPLPEAADFFIRAERLPESAGVFLQPIEQRAPVLPWRSWLVAAGLGGALTMGAGWMLRAPSIEESTAAVPAGPEDAKDGGTAAVGDSVLTAPLSPTRAPSAWSTIAVEMPLKPFPGQNRPDANGRCPGKMQVPIHGGCWLKVVADLKDCEKEGYVYKGACYVPIFPPARPATSSPAACPDNR